MKAKTRGRSKKLCDYVKPKLRPFPNEPSGYVHMSESGNAYVLITKVGTKVAFDTCGHCGIHVLHCTCKSGPYLPRSLEYCWDSDEAMSNGEEWSHDHKNYRGSLMSYTRKSNLRMSMPDIEPRVALVAVKRKRLSLYVAKARRMREPNIQKLLKGKHHGTQEH